MLKLPHVSRAPAVLASVVLGITTVASGGLLAAGAYPEPAAAKTADARQKQARVLVVTAAEGFRHRSTPAALRSLKSLGARSPRYTVVHSNNLRRWSPQYLSRFDAVVFANTTGELKLSTSQKAALIRFVSRGGGFVGLHSATDTLYDYAPFNRLIGAHFRDHPYSGGRLRRVGPAHPSTKGMPRTRRISGDEIYRFRTDPRKTGKRILLRFDTATVAGAEKGEFLPIAWCGRFGRGRVFYNALGHYPRTWRAGWFRRHLDGGISWAAGRTAPGACPRRAN